MAPPRYRYTVHIPGRSSEKIVPGFEGFLIRHKLPPITIEKVRRTHELMGEQLTHDMIYYGDGAEGLKLSETFPRSGKFDINLFDLKLRRDLPGHLPLFEEGTCSTHDSRESAVEELLRHSTEELPATEAIALRKALREQIGVILGSGLG